MNNHELLEKYKKNKNRGTIASEVCRRAGTIKYLLEYCTDSDRKFHSCMSDSISVLLKHLERNY